MLPANHNHFGNLISRKVAQSQLDKLALLEHLVAFFQRLLKWNLPVRSMQVENFHTICTKLLQ